MRLLLFLIVLLNCSVANAQQRELNNSYLFKNGIYLSFVDVAKDSPSLPLSALALREVEGSEYNFKIYEVTAKKDSLFKLSIWGLCINGMPYINSIYGDTLEFKSDRRKFVMGFSRIQTIGTICLFAESSAHLTANPNTSALIGVAAYALSDKYSSGRFKLKLLCLNTGMIEDFTDENLQQFISHDTELSNQLLSAKKPKEQMFIVLKKYNEKYPFYLDQE